MHCSEICYRLEHPKNNVGSLEHGEKWTKGLAAGDCSVELKAAWQGQHYWFEQDVTVKLVMSTLLCKTLKV
jgi:hypothetical protein